MLPDDLLIENLQSPIAEIREGTIQVIGQRNSGLTSRIPRLLDDENALVRARAAHFVARLGLRVKTGKLNSLLRDDDEIVRANAIYALGRVGNAEVVETMLPLLNNSSFLVRENARNVVFRLGNDAAKDLARQTRRR